MTKILLLFLSLLTLTSNGCGKAKKITICVSHYERSGVVCSKNGGDSFLVLYNQTNGYISLPPRDAETLFKICKLKAGGSKKDLTFCVASVDDLGLKCSKGGEPAFHVPFVDSDRYIGFPGRDAELVFSICKLRQ